MTLAEVMYGRKREEVDEKLIDFEVGQQVKDGQEVIRMSREISDQVLGQLDMARGSNSSLEVVLRLSGVCRSRRSQQFESDIRG